MSETKESYKEILKSTTLFGGVQIFGIIISLLRSKIIAILLGPMGMGIAGLINTTMNTVSGIVKLGLDTSAVKELSSAQSNNDDGSRASMVVASLKQIIRLTAIIAALLLILLSPFLSEMAFGNKDYTIAFVWVSIAVLCKQLTIGELAILQGFRKKVLLAKASILGAFFSLLISVPLYYFFGLDAIVPAIIVSSVIVFVVGRFFTSKLKISVPTLPLKRAFVEGKSMIGLGIMLSIMSMFSMITAYIVQTFISHHGGLEEVGLYLAGFVIIDSYVGMVFNAMQTDYFPKLSGISNEPAKLNQAVMDQAIIGLLLITPIIVVFLTAMPFFIRLLFSNDFLPIIGMVSWGILGTLFKAVSFSLGYVILAKGDSKVFLKTSFTFNTILLLLSLFGYYYAGLTGVGVGFLIYYIIHFLGLKIVTKKIYKLHFSKKLIFVFLVCVFLVAITFMVTWIEDDFIKYVLLVLMVIISIIFTLKQIDKKINIRNTLYNLMNRNEKNH